MEYITRRARDGIELGNPAEMAEDNVEVAARVVRERAVLLEQHLVQRVESEDVNIGPQITAQSQHSHSTVTAQSQSQHRAS